MHRSRAYLRAWPALIPFLLAVLPVLLLAAESLADGQAREGFLRALLSARALRTGATSLGIALLSCAGALLLGVPAAFLYVRSGLPGRRWIKAFFSVPFILPPLLLVIGFTGFYGKQGFLNLLLGALGLPRSSLLFGLWGIVLTQAFYNFPIVASLVSDALSGLDPSLEEAATVLGAGRLRRFLTVVLPQLLPALLASASLALLFCVQSFAVILLMGGGPKYSGLEVEIYRSLWISFDRGGALAYALIEFLFCLLVVAAYSWARRRSAGPRISPPSRPARPSSRLLPSGLFLLFLLVCVGGPLLTLVAQAFSYQTGLSGHREWGLGAFRSLILGANAPLFLRSLLDTLAAGLASSLLAVALAALSVLLSPRDEGLPATLSTVFPLAVSPMILCLALPAAIPGLSGFPGLVLFQALISLPFAAQSLRSGLAALPPSLEEAAAVLGAGKARRIFSIRLPLLSRSFLSSFAFSFALSASDLAGVLCFGANSFPTLGLLIYRLSSAYRFDLAAAAGVVLLALTALSFLASEKKR